MFLNYASAFGKLDLTAQRPHCSRRPAVSLVRRSTYDNMVRSKASLLLVTGNVNVNGYVNYSCGG